MVNRFIFSLRFSTKVFARLGTLALALLFFLSLFRLNLYFLSVFHAVPDAVAMDLLPAFFAGLRFDLLVLGFIGIPIYFLVLVQTLIKKWPDWGFGFYKFYLSLVWIVMAFLNITDYIYFQKYGKRMRFSEYSQLDIQNLGHEFLQIPNNYGWIFLAITGLLLALGLMLIWGLSFGNWKDEISPHKSRPFEIFWRFFLPIFLIALAARGTVEPRHLEQRHSEVSTFEPINEMALNPMWCLDK